MGFTISKAKDFREESMNLFLAAKPDIEQRDPELFRLLTRGLNTPLTRAERRAILFRSNRNRGLGRRRAQ